MKIDAAHFQDATDYLSPGDLNALLKLLQDIPETESIENNVISNWKNSLFSSATPIEYFYHHDYDQRIQDILLEYTQRLTPNPSELFKHFATQSGWTEEQGKALNRIPVDELVDFIKTSDSSEFKNLVTTLHKISKSERFATVKTNYKTACNAIINDENISQNKHLIYILQNSLNELFPKENSH